MQNIQIRVDLTKRLGTLSTPIEVVDAKIVNGMLVVDIHEGERKCDSNPKARDD